MSHQLILTVTRACNLRCSYCPTAKDGWPSLEGKDVRQAIDLFIAMLGGGSIKIFGGEPLLVPEVVREVCDYAAHKKEIQKIYLSTNGLGLNEEWISWLRGRDKIILTLSIDGQAEDHNKMRRAIEGQSRSYEHVMSLKRSLLSLKRLVVTQTIAPATADRAYKNFMHLYVEGFRKFNFLPGYYIPWREEQLIALEVNFKQITDFIEQQWKNDSFVYVRNLFIQAPTPFFNTGLVIDSDRSIHANNLGLSAKLSPLRKLTQVGSLDEPPNKRELEAKSREIRKILQHHLPEKIWLSTQEADAALSRFCARLWPAFLQYKKRKVSA